MTLVPNMNNASAFPQALYMQKKNEAMRWATDNGMAMLNGAGLANQQSVRIEEYYDAKTDSLLRRAVPCVAESAPVAASGYASQTPTHARRDNLLLLEETP